MSNLGKAVEHGSLVRAILQSSDHPLVVGKIEDVKTRSKCCILSPSFRSSRVVLLDKVQTVLGAARGYCDEFEPHRGHVQEHHQEDSLVSGLDLGLSLQKLSGTLLKDKVSSNGAITSQSIPGISTRTMGSLQSLSTYFLGLAKAPSFLINSLLGSESKG